LKQVTHMMAMAELLWHESALAILTMEEMFSWLLENLQMMRLQEVP